MDNDIAKEAHHAAVVLEQLVKKLIKHDDRYLQNLGLDLRNTAGLIAEAAEYIQEKHANE